MKKFVYILVASLALVACTPKNGVSNKVRIAVSFEDEQQPNTGQQRISAVDRVLEDKRVIDVNWEDKDVLYWDTGDGIDTQNPFKIVSGVGKKSAFFENESFIDYKDVFTLYYHGADIPDFVNSLKQTQVVTINKNGETEINNDYLMYTATNCKVGSGIELKPNFAVLGVRITNNSGNNAALNDLKNHYCVIGNFQNSYESTDIACCINDERTESNDNSLMFYFVYPCIDDEPINIKNKNIWLATAEYSNSRSPRLLIEKDVNLLSGKAMILDISLTGFDSNAAVHANRFIISK